MNKIGIITINDNSIPYELVNLAKTTLYLKTPNIANLFDSVAELVYITS